MTFVTQGSLEQTRENAAKAASIYRGLQEIFSHYADLVPNQANANLVCSWCQDFAGDAVPHLPTFRAAVDANRDLFRQSFVFQSIAKQIEGLIAECLGLLKAHGSHTKESLAKERFKLESKTRDELIVRRDEIIQKQVDVKLPIVDLKQRVHDFREREARAQSALPPEYTPERIAKGSVHLVKYLVARYGANAVNQRLSEES